MSTHQRAVCGGYRRCLPFLSPCLLSTRANGWSCSRLLQSRALVPPLVCHCDGWVLVFFPCVPPVSLSWLSLARPVCFHPSLFSAGVGVAPSSCGPVGTFFSRCVLGGVHALVSPSGWILLNLASSLTVCVWWRSLGQLSVILAAACMYIMWATCYLHQLYPLIRPIKPAHSA